MYEIKVKIKLCMSMNTLISIKKCEKHNKLTSVGIGTENIDFLFFIISKIFICFYEIKKYYKVVGKTIENWAKCSPS